MAAARITVKEAYEKGKSGRALLICAYDSEEKFERYHLGHSFSLHDFTHSLTEIPKTEELIFYCA